MRNFFTSIYSHFLFRKITTSEFLEMKDYVNKMSDKELSDSMEKVWMENLSIPSMKKAPKARIKSILSFNIERDLKRKKQVNRYKYTAAASLAALIVTSISFWLISTNQMAHLRPFEAQVSRGDKVDLTLPDNSKVKLNSESFLRYDLSNRKIRDVKLSGEAFFEVEKDKNKPFIVDLGDISIEVLGTTFNISSYEEDNIIETSLIEGSIRLKGMHFSSYYYLKPSEKAIYNKKDKSIQIIKTDNEYETAWTENQLIFSSEPLSNVIHKIERWYGVDIDLRYKDIASDIISGSFKNEPLSYVMEALKMQYKFSYTINGNKIIISK